MKKTFSSHSFLCSQFNQKPDDEVNGAINRQKASGTRAKGALYKSDEDDTEGLRHYDVNCSSSLGDMAPVLAVPVSRPACAHNAGFPVSHAVGVKFYSSHFYV